MRKREERREKRERSPSSVVYGASHQQEVVLWRGASKLEEGSG
jgi:hypothetical protein